MVLDNGFEVCQHGVCLRISNNSVHLFLCCDQSREKQIHEKYCKTDQNQVHRTREDHVRHIVSMVLIFSIFEIILAFASAMIGDAYAAGKGYQPLREIQVFKVITA